VLREQVALVLLITRRVPEAVATRAGREFATRQLHLVGEFDPLAVLANLSGVDAILCTPADRFDAGLITQLPETVRVIGTFSVGVEHITWRRRRRGASPFAIPRTCCRWRRRNWR
jgi:lactate dehydrogenase-like 2-hydroxyacid dehydrogenase